MLTQLPLLVKDYLVDPVSMLVQVGEEVHLLGGVVAVPDLDQAIATCRVYQCLFLTELRG